MIFVARCYASESQAQAAMDAALEAGYNRRSIVMLAPPSESSAEAADGLTEVESGSASSASAADAVRAGEWMGRYTEFYTSRLDEGNTLLVMNPPVYGSLQAERILDAHDPLDVYHIETPEPTVPFAERNWMFSDVLGLGTLSDGTLSGFLGLNTKQEGLSHFSRWFSPLSSNFTFSSKIGMGFSSASATPLSNMIGFSTKSTRMEGKTSSFGIPVKAKRETPLSTFLNMPTLSKRRYFLTEDENAPKPEPQPYVPYSQQTAPFSHMLGLKVLSNGTFSGAFGMGTKSAGLTHLSRFFSPLASDFKFSKMIGMGFATSSATPLSSMVGLSTKSERMEGKYSSFGMSTSTAGGTPLSNMLGLPTLTKKKFFLS